MRKITLLIALFFISFTSQAQIANGSVAPDFTVTDINGVTHTLSDYLAAGKTVIMDISATWCGPCWNYHNNHTLDDMYTAYGPDGSDEVVVLFIEGDPTTTLADLNGTGNNTQGDWVAGSPYAIIDSGAIADLYQIAYFPTVFRICPNGIVNEVGTVGAASLRNGINANCGTLTGVQNHAHAMDNENSLCTTAGAPVAKFKNYGENAITSANLNLLENGAVVASKAFAGTVNRFATRTVAFDNMVLNPESEYTFELVDVNASALFDPTHNIADMGIRIAGQAALNVVLHVKTDNWPTEITWKLKNSANVVVAEGGPYVGGANGGGADANTTKIHDLTLIEGECYSIQLLDSYGDGWSLGNTPHGIEIFSEDVSIYSLEVGNFGTSLNKTAVMSTSALGVGESDAAQFGVYPNPTNGIVRINTESAVQVTISDILGKVVYRNANVTSETSIDLSGFQKGMYMAQIAGESGTSTEKIILN